MSSYFWNSGDGPPGPPIQPPGGGGWPPPGWQRSMRWLGPPAMVGGGHGGIPGGAVSPTLSQAQIDNINSAIANYQGPNHPLINPGTPAPLPEGITGSHATGWTVNGAPHPSLTS